MFYNLISNLLNFNNVWFPKSMLMLITLIIFTYSIFVNNSYINKYILPILLFLNIAILIYITLSHKLNLLNILGLIGIVYLLYLFQLEDFEFKNGFLLKVNKQWIYLHILSLTIYYLLSTYIPVIDKIALILILYYPLLFPINEYFKHRIYSLILIILILRYLRYIKLL